MNAHPPVPMPPTEAETKKGAKLRIALIEAEFAEAVAIEKAKAARRAMAAYHTAFDKSPNRTRPMPKRKRVTLK